MLQFLNGIGDIDAADNVLETIYWRDDHVWQALTSITDENVSRVRKLFAIDRRLNLRLLAERHWIFVLGWYRRSYVMCYRSRCNAYSQNCGVGCILAFVRQCSWAFINYCGTISRQKRSHPTSPSTHYLPHFATAHQLIFLKLKVASKET